MYVFLKQHGDYFIHFLNPSSFKQSKLVNGIMINSMYQLTLKGHIFSTWLGPWSLLRRFMKHRSMETRTGLIDHA